ncbi:rRNA processing protein [Heracleum sosnowskyi]|uniref:rRNA processing protein n=1 Tax=Heracleum sosnowskyi TaxID=360622 RepID=A0AAD8JBV3_9APIA|nr:rRNA processing protein [Heracleum sosnowskyi]
MLNSALELFKLVASNSFIVFCFCNLIIMILLIGSSKSASDTDEDSTSLPSKELVRGSKKCMTAQSKKSCTSFNDKNELRGFKEPCVDRNLLNFEEVGRKDDEDDELRKRVEAFIDKTTKAWKTEMLQKCNVIR